jgi:asparagine synthase (glutamine-hydrolysing)
MSSVFLFLVRPSGEPVSEEQHRFDASATRNELPPLRWVVEANYAVALGPDVTGLGTDPVLARTHRLVVVGNARLDNREEVAGWSAAPRRTADATDLEIIAEAIETRGTKCIPGILGDFAIVVWNPFTQELVAARDTFGIRALFYCATNDLIAFASQASLCADGKRYDLEYIADFLVGGLPSVTHTIYAGTLAVPPAGVVTVRNRRFAVDRYWTPEDFPIDEALTGEAAIDTIRELIVRAVTAGITGRDDTWSQLSGGLDSSTLVSVTQSLASTGRIPSGLGGTVTLVDTLGTGDERIFSEAVVRRWPVRNETLTDYWLWRDDEFGPPITDEPALAYPFYARDRRMCMIVRSSGGRVLLNGTGPDHYLAGSALFIADLLARGAVRTAAHEVARWATVVRGSFWRTGYRSAVLPLLPGVVRRAVVPTNQRVPKWIDRGFARQFTVQSRLPAARTLREPWGGKYAGDVAERVRNVSRSIDRGVVAGALDVRYPLLFRPLVEFSLRLPPAMRTRPHARKWILREALRGVLPEEVRTRPGKGGIDGRIAWSLIHERPRLEALLREPVLGDLGCIQVSELRAAITDARASDPALRAFTLCALSLETWLCVRSGRWTDLSAARKCISSQPTNKTEVHHGRSQPADQEGLYRPSVDAAGRGDGQNTRHESDHPQGGSGPAGFRRGQQLGAI